MTLALSPPPADCPVCLLERTTDSTDNGVDCVSCGYLSALRDIELGGHSVVLMRLCNRHYASYAAVLAVARTPLPT